tara:strand:- start:1082 stop:1288 length:207 start_codon:yes stop_codon:yes gene_type:complete
VNSGHCLRSYEKPKGHWEEGEGVKNSGFTYGVYTLLYVTTYAVSTAHTKPKVGQKENGIITLYVKETK